MGRKKYKTEEERKAAIKESQKKWREKNPNYMSEWRKNHPENVKSNWNRWANKIDWNDYMAKFMAKKRLTLIGRAEYLEINYKRLDKENNRGESTITAEWIVENVFSKPCHYCGETDWRKLGCDRINNTLPHTPENVVPCCGKCNVKKGTMKYDEFMRMIGKIV